MWKHRHTIKTGKQIPWIILSKLKMKIKKFKDIFPVQKTTKKLPK